MAGSYNDSVARRAEQGQVAIVATDWRELVSGGPDDGDTAGLTPLKARRQLRYQIKADKGMTMAIAYTAKNEDGSFTAPTDGVAHCTIIPGNSTVVEPLGDSVMIWGKLLKKAGATDDSARVVVTEYA
jgi:hypothetical protein